MSKKNIITENKNASEFTIDNFTSEDVKIPNKVDTYTDEFEQQLLEKEKEDKKNIIVLRTWKKNSKTIVQPHKDKYGRFHENVRDVDKDGNLILSDEELKLYNSGKVYYVKKNEQIELKNGTTFDLNDIFDYSRWNAIKNTDLIAKNIKDIINSDEYAAKTSGAIGNIPSIVTQYGKIGHADFYIETKGELSSKIVNNKLLIAKAYGHVSNDTHAGRLTKCKLLGVPMENALSDDVIRFLLEKCDSNPKLIIELYTGQDNQLRLLIIDAKKKGLIMFKHGVFYYYDTKLGFSLEGVLEFLKESKNTFLLKSLTKECYPSDKE